MDRLMIFLGMMIFVLTIPYTAETNGVLTRIVFIAIGYLGLLPLLSTIARIDKDLKSLKKEEKKEEN